MRVAEPYFTRRLPLGLAVLFCISATASADYAALGEYTPTTNVTEHSELSLDIQKIKNLLDEDTPNYAEALDVYQNGMFSMKSSGLRTLQGITTKNMTGEFFYDQFVAFHDSHSYWDDYILPAFDGSGVFDRRSDDMRKLAINKGLCGAMVMYVTHEMEEAIIDAEAGSMDAARKHWDEAWAFHYGTGAHAADANGKYGYDFMPWRVAGKRDADFGTDVQGDMTDAFLTGQSALSSTYNQAAVAEAMADIIEGYTITYMQAALKYSYKVQTNPNDYEWSEGYTYFRAIDGYLAGSASTMLANRITNAFTIANLTPDSLVYCKTEPSLAGMYASLGLTEYDVKTYTGMTVDPCASLQEDYVPHDDDGASHEEDHDYVVPWEGGADSDSDDSAAAAAAATLLAAAVALA